MTCSKNQPQVVTMKRPVVELAMHVSQKRRIEPGISKFDNVIPFYTLERPRPTRLHKMYRLYKKNGLEGRNVNLIM